MKRQFGLTAQLTSFIADSEWLFADIVKSYYAMPPELSNQ